MGRETPGNQNNCEGEKCWDYTGSLLSFFNGSLPPSPQLGVQMDQQCQTCSCAYLTHRDLISCLLASQQWADLGGDCSQLQRERKIESSPRSLILHNRLHSVRARTATLLHLSLPLALNHCFSALLSLLRRKLSGLELGTTTARAALLHETTTRNFYWFQVSDSPLVLPLASQGKEKRRQIEFGCWSLQF